MAGHTALMIILTANRNRFQNPCRAAYSMNSRNASILISAFSFRVARRACFACRVLIP